MVFEPMNVSLSLKLYSNTTDGLTVGYDICCTVRKESKAINTFKAFDVYYKIICQNLCTNFYAIP